MDRNGLSADLTAGVALAVDVLDIVIGWKCITILHLHEIGMLEYNIYIYCVATMISHSTSHYSVFSLSGQLK